MSDFLTKLLEILEHLSPMKIVYEWEKGVLYRFGKLRRTLEPGIYWIIPLLWEIKSQSVVLNPHTCSMQTVTLCDGKNLTFNILVSVEITDAAAAYNNVHNFEESCKEIAMSWAADVLARSNAVELVDAGKRAAILEKIQTETNRNLNRFGCNAVNFSLQSFAVVKTLRIIQDFNNKAT